MQYDTAGNPIIFYDMCGYCEMDTGGNHHPDCPCARLTFTNIPYKPKVNVFWQLTERG